MRRKTPEGLRRKHGGRGRRATTRLSRDRGCGEHRRKFFKRDGRVSDTPIVGAGTRGQRRSGRTSATAGDQRRAIIRVYLAKSVIEWLRQSSSSRRRSARGGASHGRTRARDGRARSRRCARPIRFRANDAGDVVGRNAKRRHRRAPRILDRRERPTRTSALRATRSWRRGDPSRLEDPSANARPASHASL